MGMDYAYAGSASYGRFDDELTELAKRVFHAKLTEEYLKRKQFIDSCKKSKNNIFYPFGYLHPNVDDTNKEKFIFPKHTKEVIKKFFNNPYGDFTDEETKQIADIIINIQ